MADGLTGVLARYVVGTQEVPPDVRRHATRTFLNVVGCAVGGAHHDAVTSAARALLPLSGGGSATVIGRGERTDPLLAAMLNGMSAAVYSFDDTHSQAVVHPGGAVGCALVALAECRRVSGREFLLAYALGIEVVCRLSKALSVPPAVNETGWIQTGITGGIGAAVAVAKVLGLDAAQTAAAMGIAACQAGGMRALSRSMCFSLMAGQAAQAGLRAALLAAQDFSGAADMLEAPGGFLQLYSRGSHSDHIERHLGTEFELLHNTFKPYPCGVVLHPVIDAGLDLSARGLAPERIEAIVVKLAPASIRLGDIAAPRTVQEGQMSLQHWVAAALVDGVAGLAQGRAARLADEKIGALRARVRLEDAAELARDAALVEVTLLGGEVLTSRVDHCRGSAARPMGDDDLDLKFRLQCRETLPHSDVERLLSLCRNLQDLDDVSEAIRASAGTLRSGQ